MSKSFCVLGVDPGYRVTGYGLVQTDGQHSEPVDFGCIRTGDGDVALRLQRIFGGLCEVISKFRPDVAVLEQVFLARNPGTALKLGQARAAAILAAAEGKIPVREYAVRSIKQAVTGSGRADKAQVQYMVRQLLNLDAPLQEDAADALAAALCHAHVGPSSAGHGDMRRRRSRTVSVPAS